jgi:raffinose/stachyose/melibiose transport system permease protein
MNTAVPYKKPRWGSRMNPGGWYWMLYLAPALIMYVVFMAWPLLDSVRLSLYTGNLADRSYVGLQNFVTLFYDAEVSKRFWGAFGNTWYFFLIHMIFQNILGIFFATLLTHPTLRGRTVYQTIIFLPTTFAVTITGFLWKMLLNPTWITSFVNPLGLGFLAKPWLGQESTALTAISLVSCWQWVGIPTMMFVASLRNISEDLLEASSIEGANSWHSFWRIKLPLIRPVVVTVAILTFVSNFNAFDIVFAMEGSNAPPNFSTDLIGTLFYRVGIAGAHPVGIPDPGLGTAIATVTFFMLMIVVIPTIRITQARE